MDDADDEDKESAPDTSASDLLDEITGQKQLF